MTLPDRLLPSALYRYDVSGGSIRPFITFKSQAHPDMTYDSGKLAHRPSGRGRVGVGKIHWGRVILCGILAGLTWTILSSIVTAVVGKDFAAAVPDARLTAPKAGLVVFFVRATAQGQRQL
jgi:hypothetical protein